MATRLILPGPDDAAEIVEALLTAAGTRDHHAPAQAARWRQLANDIGDALDTLPTPHAQEGTP
jgi:hypothetical protein